ESFSWTGSFPFVHRVPARRKEKKSMWSTFFRDGGWGMYPTALFGFIFVASGFVYLFRPEGRFAPIVVGAEVLTVGADLLSTSVSIVKTFRYLPEVPQAEQLQIAALGCAESLNNLVLALILTLLTTLLAWVAVVRGVRMPSPDRRMGQPLACAST